MQRALQNQRKQQQINLMLARSTLFGLTWLLSLQQAPRSKIA
jgi:hypothetical protein